jgi:hypothetical protein
VTLTLGHCHRSIITCLRYIPLIQSKETLTYPQYFPILSSHRSSYLQCSSQAFSPQPRAPFIQSSGKTSMGNAVVVNRCPYPLYLWLVDQNESPPTPITILSKGKHVEPFRMPCVERGVSLEVSKTPSLSSIVQFEYALNKSGLLYHDISLTNCASGNDASACPGHVHGLKVEGMACRTARRWSAPRMRIARLVRVMCLCRAHTNRRRHAARPSSAALRILLPAQISSE